MWLMAGWRQWKWKRRKLWLMAEFGVSACVHSCICLVLERRRISGSAPLPPSPVITRCIQRKWAPCDMKIKDEGQHMLFSAYFASQFTTQHLIHLHDMTTTHINLCSQAYLDAIPVNCHDNFARGRLPMTLCTRLDLLAVLPPLNSPVN